MRLKNSFTGNDKCGLSNIRQILASLGAAQESVISAIEQAKVMSNMILIRQWVLYLPTYFYWVRLNAMCFYLGNLRKIIKNAVRRAWQPSYFSF